MPLKQNGGCAISRSQLTRDRQTHDSGADNLNENNAFSLVFCIVFFFA